MTTAAGAGPVGVAAASARPPKPPSDARVWVAFEPSMGGTSMRPPTAT